MRFIHPDDDTHLATVAEADQEWAINVGREHPERAWILSDRDVWYPNPAYSGPKVPHPEEGYEDMTHEPWDTDGDTSKWNENGEGSEADNDRYASRANPDDDIPF